jgi:hypothetical protein
MKQTQFEQIAHLGLVIDRPPEEVSGEFWTAGKNIYFRDGMTVRAAGWAEYAPPLPSADPQWALCVVNATAAYWLVCYETSVWVTDGITHWDITPVGGLAPSVAGDWTGGVLNGIPFLNNPNNPPIYWNLNTSTPMAVLPGWPSGARCRSLRAHKYHLIALAITDGGIFYGDQLWWSEGAQPGTLPQSWTPAPDNDAGDTILADTPGDIVDGASLRDIFMVYKDWSTYTLQYVAGQYVFAARKTFETVGIQSRNCVAELNGEHWVFTGNDVIRTDGQVYQSAVDDIVKRALVESVNPSRRQLSCVIARQLSQQVSVSIAAGSSDKLDTVYLINAIDGAVGVADLPQANSLVRGVVEQGGAGSWTGDDEAWDLDASFWNQRSYSPTDDSALICAPGHLWIIGVSQTQNGQPVHAYVERTGLPIGEFTDHKLFTQLVPRIDGQPGEVLTITMGGQNFFDGPVTWGTPQPFTIGTSVAVMDIVEGRMFCMKVEGTTQNQWRMHRYSLRWASRGLY